MKKTTVFGFLFLFLLGMVSANTEDFSQAEALIQQRTSCDQLTQDQLEMLGDYYMEQMHPGETHEYMDQMMGGEGSESLRRVHINMALRIYCGETSYPGYGMMGGYGMMNSYPTGMMGYNYPAYTYRYNWLMPLTLALIIVLLAILIFKQTKKK